MTERYHHGDLRDALLAAATDMLAETGPRGLSLREAARRAGVSTGAPYRHFKDKDALLTALATRGFLALDAALRAVDTAAADATPLERLRRLGVAYVEFAIAQPALFRLMFGEFGPATDASEELAQAVRASGAHLPAAVEAVRREGLLGDFETEDVTLLAWSVVHGVASLYLDGHLHAFERDGESSGVGVAERVTRVLVAAVSSAAH
ncbi:MAG: TetR/AcrR family transcriptional regulator [Myxococcales bacterium]|nr:TetR/AcrR family transcriptional regulator [Myxococcales bacterium]MCB9626192.1 TetR/AcrR family transcriptional regulator [Sandaracinaceae bacterium]